MAGQEVRRQTDAGEPAHQREHDGDALGDRRDVEPAGTPPSGERREVAANRAMLMADMRA